MCGASCSITRSQNESAKREIPNSAKKSESAKEYLLHFCQWFACFKLHNHSFKANIFEISMTNKVKILRSSYDFVKESVFKYPGISQYLLEKANENVANGRNKWMVCNRSKEKFDLIYFGLKFPFLPFPLHN